MISAIGDCTFLFLFQFHSMYTFIFRSGVYMRHCFLSGLDKSIPVKFGIFYELRQETSTIDFQCKKNQLKILTCKTEIFIEHFHLFNISLRTSHADERKLLK